MLHICKGGVDLFFVFVGETFKAHTAVRKHTNNLR